MQTHKNALVSITIRDRVISLKFWTHEVSKQYTLPNFQIFFFFPKIAAILIQPDSKFGSNVDFNVGINQKRFAKAACRAYLEVCLGVKTPTSKIVTGKKVFKNV